ncbi:thioredoxin family protein [Halapricum desulfuricans]|uniref:Thioredoxin n=1 Tax=Halapricum desulfuricans TaxID=2841257 RepID=A0A897N5U8_9EURY|nr:thioredoxin family protein [Halapricum desulfuricans]QSG07648.1 Thiol-disulfide isomerase or thioredoxin [Halapricum desulfuricans]QSG13181.1 Thiol-disulfide isomerase or thioredoxin [Halapricum desulfuricans]
MKIEVIGPGCARCKKTAQNVNKALETLDGEVEATVEKVEAQMEIIDRGVMHTPAVAVDGDVAVEGEIPDVDQLVDLFETA